MNFSLAKVEPLALAILHPPSGLEAELSTKALPLWIFIGHTLCLSAFSSFYRRIELKGWSRTGVRRTPIGWLGAGGQTRGWDYVSTKGKKETQNAFRGNPAEKGRGTSWKRGPNSNLGPSSKSHSLLAGCLQTHRWGHGY